MGKADASIERRTTPNAPRLNATVIGWLDLDKVGGTAVLEQHRDIAMLRELVALGGKVIMPLSIDQRLVELEQRCWHDERADFRNAVRAQEQRG